MISSNKFISIEHDDLDIHYIPNINEDVPVISCIGTSRDGKSTLLNFYTEWLEQSNSNFLLKLFGIKIINPFLAQQSDDAVTNGIDYFYIKGKCLLLDCQGMQLNSAKFDHYLALITYLISNVIILTVRQRLDLQVLNNLLSVFGFLSEIPEQYRRKDRSKLIIRIKDFQNIKMLKENKNYLNELVEKWLEKSNDQYDQIKEAFKITFDIYPIATLTPKFDGDELDIYHKDFISKNPSFTDACIKINELSKDFQTCELLKDKDKMKQFIKSLKENKEIDFRKLDLYHNITNVELLKYLNNNIKIEPYTDKTLDDKMNGSRKAFNEYRDRYTKLNDLKEYTYNTKFKDVPIKLKDEIFKEIFDEYYSFLIKYKDKNMIKSREIIKKNTDNFYTKIVYNLDDYNKKFKILEDKLNEIDPIVANEILDEINKNRENFQETLKTVNKINTKQKSLIESLIKTYDISKNYKIKLDEIIEKLNSDCDFRNFKNTKKILNDIENNIIKDIQIILDENNNFYRIKTDRKDNNIEAIKNILNAKDYLIKIENYEETIKENISSKLNKIGLLNYTLKFNHFPYINFIRFELYHYSFVMTRNFYENHFNNIHKELRKKYNIKEINLDEDSDIDNSDTEIKFNENIFFSVERCSSKDYEDDEESDNDDENENDEKSDNDDENDNDENENYESEKNYNIIIISLLVEGCQQTNYATERGYNVVNYSEIIENKFISEIVDYMLEHNFKLC